MSLGIKTADGVIPIRSVRVKPTTTTKAITTNGIYSAADDNVDGYSSVTVRVAAETPDDMELYGVVNNDHVWNDNVTRKYLILSESERYDRVCLQPNTFVRIPKGTRATLRWDKEGVQINCFNVNPDGSQRDLSPYSWSDSIVVDRTAESTDFYFSPSGKKPDNTDFNVNELPTKLIVTYDR